MELGLFDTAGLDAYDYLFLMAYPDADIVLLCFSIGSPDSLDDIKAKVFEPTSEGGRSPLVDIL